MFRRTGIYIIAEGTFHLIGGRMQNSKILHPVHTALHEFEEAVKKHEHLSLTESEVSRRQVVDRARQHVLDVVVELVKKD